MQKVNNIRNPLPPIAGLSALLPCLLFGNIAFVTWLGARAAWLLLPTSLGVPFAFPRLRFVAFVGQPGWNLTVELLAVAVLAVVAAWWVRRAGLLRPEANTWRVLLSSWAGVVLGLAAANALRAGAAVLVLGSGPLLFLSYVLLGAVTGALWAIALGWPCALPVALVHRFRRSPAAPVPA
ncbi:hypothetical protein [Nocardiopsis alba]|uniref:hypothetical protein n=1 Tax=Nocardiopsis alba TaxID=53437 RepID=UPI003D727C2C